jgi:hypothetical protein
VDGAFGGAEHVLGPNPTHSEHVLGQRARIQDDMETAVKGIQTASSDDMLGVDCAHLAM